MAPPAIPDDEEISAWFDRPAQARVHPEVLDLRVVLEERREDEVRVERVDALELPEVHREVALGEMSDVVFRCEDELQVTRSLGPLHGAEDLREVTIVELAEPDGAADRQ